MTDDSNPEQISPSDLIPKLVDSAFEVLSGGLVRVITADPFDPVSEGGGGIMKPLSQWEMVMVPEERLVEATETALRKGAVLLLPAWRRTEPEERALARFRPLAGPATTAEQVLLAQIRPEHPNAVLAAALPTAALVSDLSRKFREVMDQHWQPAAVLSVEGHLAGVHPRFLWSIVFWRTRARESKGLMRMFEVPRRREAGTVYRDFQRLFRMEGGGSEFGFVVRDPIAPGESLSFHRFDPKKAESAQELTNLGTTLELAELFDVLLGGFQRHPDSELVCAPGDEGAVRVLRGGDIMRDGSIGPADEEATWAKLPQSRQLQAGDLVLRSKYTPTSADGFVVAGVTPADLPVAPTAGLVTALRPKPGVTEQQRALALLYLRSPRSLEMMSREASSPGMLTRSALARIPVPQPDRPLSAALQDLADAEAQLGQWAADIRALRDSILRDESAAQARERLIGSGRTLRLRVEAARRLDDLGYIVRSGFPHPVAYQWRSFEAESSVGPTRATYTALLDTAECLLAYSALVCLSLARESSLKVGARGEIVKKLASGWTGPALGDWVAVLREIATAKAFRSLPDDHALAVYRSLLGDTEVTDAIARLSDRRHDEAHQRQVDATELPQAIADAQADLVSLLSAAQFLTEHRLIEIVAHRWDTLTRTGEVSCRVLMGDHPVVPTTAMRYDSPEIESGSLYLVDETGGLHLLRPFLNGQVCPTCRHWSTFRADRFVPATGAVRWVSLEHGHVLELKGGANALRSAGLLPAEP